MSRFDHGDEPLVTAIGAAYLALLEPLRVDCAHPLPDRTPYVRTLRQLENRPTRADIDEHGHGLTGAMPAVAVHIDRQRVEGRSSQVLDWRLDVDVHCFCDAMERGAEVRQDRENGTRALTQHVIEHLHQRVPLGEFDAQGVEVQDCERVATTPRVDWWRVSTTLDVRQYIRRQRTPAVEAIEFHQLGRRREPLAAPLILDFASAQNLIEE